MTLATRLSLPLLIGLLALACSGTTKVPNQTDTGKDTTPDDYGISFEDTHSNEEVNPWEDNRPEMKPRSDKTEQDEIEDVHLDDIKDVDTKDQKDLGPDDEPEDLGKDTGPCTPNCTGKLCGADGCGGVCGFCEYGYLCADGKCEPSLCPAQCSITIEGKPSYKECGENGCGGYCGYCMEEKYCGVDGLCYAGSCTGTCGTRNCGDDGCGHSCGNCQQGEICSEAGKCIPNPCGDVTYKGKCTSMYMLVECINYHLIERNCLELPDRICGWDQNVGKYDCVPEGSCQPNCMFADDTPKECGDDGCWGSCGTCPEGWGCAAGICEPAEGGACAWIDNVVGDCVGTIRWFCSAGLLYGYDCMAEEGKYCGWKASANLGKGGYDCL